MLMACLGGGTVSISLRCCDTITGDVVPVTDSTAHVFSSAASSSNQIPGICLLRRSGDKQAN